MKHARWKALAAALAVAGCASGRGPGPAAAQNWDLIGTMRVSFAEENDVLQVGPGDGRFNAIRIQVTEGDLEMFNIQVVFGDGSRYSPDTRVSFRQGSRSRLIDLPGGARVIRRISFAYRSQVQRGRATVRIYGRRA